MKSPDEIAQKMARQWQNDKLRAERLLGDADWPLRYPIGPPSAKEVEMNWGAVAEHIQHWRSVTVGEVAWKSVSYRSTGAPVQIPEYWEIYEPAQWVMATTNRDVASEFATLEDLLGDCDPLFHSTLVRQRSLWRNRSRSEVKKAAELAMRLEPGCAHGVPLRALPHEGIDSKFFERNRSLLTRLLDLRFDGEPSQQGLETFLDAQRDTDHWLLVADLDGELLPFFLQRVRSTELSSRGLPARHLLLVENERCLHLLPSTLPGTVAVLGTGNNLGWLKASWLKDVTLGYWGDIDTWGLLLLARARTCAPHLSALLMDQETFDKLSENYAVVEPVISSETPPESLTEAERELFCHLRGCREGRLEQEFIPKEFAAQRVAAWWNASL